MLAMPQPKCFCESNQGIGQGSDSQYEQMTVVEMGSKIKENSGVMTGWIEMKMAYEFFSQFLDIGMDVPEDRDGSCKNQEPLACLYRGHQP